MLNRSRNKPSFSGSLYQFSKVKQNNVYFWYFILKCGDLHFFNNVRWQPELLYHFENELATCVVETA